jgi:hypothetical protein
VSGSCYLQALATVDKRTNPPSNRTGTRPCPFETCPPSHVPFTMTSVAFPKSIFSELAADLPRRACRTGESITMSTKGTWLNLGIISSTGKIALAFLFLLYSATSFAATSGGGACPTGANYLNPSNPTGSLVTLSSLGITNCYFISSSGSDTNNGKSESAPWAHAPLMPNCTGNCAVVTVGQGTQLAGTGFIFEGNNTWHFGQNTGDYTGGVWTWNPSVGGPSGTSSNPIYVGVDPGWPSSGWTRPTFTADNSLCNSGTTGTMPDGYTCTSTTDFFGQPSYIVSGCAYQIAPQTSGAHANDFFDMGNQGYIIVDNIELTGLCQSSVGQPGHQDEYFSYPSMAGPVFFTNDYIHGASHVAFAAKNGSAGCTGSTVCINATVFNGGPSDRLFFNVVDFSDSDPGGENLCLSGFNTVAYNVFRYFTQCLASPLHLVHDNLWEYYFENGHSNLIESYDPVGTNAVYNNVFRHVENLLSSGGGVFLWLGPCGTAQQNCSGGATDYIFNNVGYDVGGVQYLNIGGTALTQVQGNYVFFNNTWQSNVSQSIVNCQYQTVGSTIDTNNHYIDNHTPYLSCPSLTTTTPLVQTTAQADSNVSVHFDQYTASEPQGYSPVASTNSTVIAGTNVYNSLCAALGNAGMTAAQTACESNTTYACSYAGNGAVPVCPAGALNARPQSAVWDVGAYEFNSQNAPPNPPTGLTAVVN